MCGRLNLLTSSVELAEFFELFRPPEWSPRYNLGPMQRVLVVRHKKDGVRLAEPLQWGLVPSWSHDPTTAAQMINARSDTVTSKPAFRDSIRKRRCLVPASGYYEWQPLNRKTKQAWHIVRADGQPFALAGLWDQWQSHDGNTIESCAVITTDANQQISEIHTRMPVLLPKEMWPLWLDEREIEPSALAGLLLPSTDIELKIVPVGSFVNNIRNDSPECIRPVKPPLTLF